MSKIENVTVVKAANVYFEGRVTSRTILFADGSRKSLGIMLPGEYEFGTAEKEIMEIQSGELDVLLPGTAEWLPVKGGDSFEVPPSSKFKMRVKTISDYCCSFIA
jgi:purine/pyrimidine-nucleoside phosphorylase